MYYFHGKPLLSCWLRLFKQTAQLRLIHTTNHYLFISIFNISAQNSANKNPCVTWQNVRELTADITLFSRGVTTQSSDILAKVHEGIQTRERIWGCADPELLDAKYHLAPNYEFSQNWALSADLWRQIYQSQIRKQPQDRLPIFREAVRDYGYCLRKLGQEQDLEELKQEFPGIDWEEVEEEYLVGEVERESQLE